jgi:hypothetical protein
VSSNQPSKPATDNPLLKWIYLALAIAGAVLPWLANIEFIREYGSSFDLGLFVQLANANPAAGSLSRDLAIGATAVVIWIVQESRRLKMRGLGAQAGRAGSRSQPIGLILLNDLNVNGDIAGIELVLA